MSVSHNPQAAKALDGWGGVRMAVEGVKLTEAEQKKKDARQAKEQAEIDKINEKVDSRYLVALGLKAKELTTIEDLAHLEERRAAIMKQAHGGSTFSIATSWHGTAIKWASQTFRFHATMATFLGVRAIIMLNMLRDPSFLEKVPPMDMGKVAIIGAFHSLFLVFFASQSYARFEKQYSASMAAEGHLNDICLLASNCISQDPEGIAGAHRLFRHVNAAHLLAYVGLSPVYTTDNFLKPFNDIHRLLSPLEMKRMLEIKPDEGAHAYREVLGWAVRDVQNENAAGRLGNPEAGMLRGQVLGLRASLTTLYDFHAQPVPFFYVHLITMISGFYLPLFAYGVAVKVELSESDNTLMQLICHIVGFASSGVAVMAVAFSIIGLQEVGMKLADPFGDDSVDLSVMSFVVSTLEATRRVISRPKGEEFSLDLEHALARQAVEMMTPHDSDPKETSIYHLNAGSVKDCKSEVFPSRDSTLYDTSHPTIAKAMARHPNEYNADGSVKDTKRKTHIKTTNPLLQTKSIVDLDVVGGVGGGDDDE